MAPNYQLGKIYRIWSPLNVELQYIGSTTQELSKRIYEHKREYKEYIDGFRHYMTSFDLIEIGEAKIELIEHYPCNSKNELEAREGYFIRTMNCVNKRIEGRTKKEYYTDNKEELLQKKKIYYEKYRDRILAYHIEYRIDNSEVLKEKSKVYYEANKETFAIKQAELITCECGSVVSKGNLSRHKISPKHIKLMETQTETV